MASRPSVKAKILTWEKTSTELFDYQDSQVVPSTLKTNSSSFLVRANSSPFFLQKPIKPEQVSMKFLSHLQPHEENFVLSPAKLILPKSPGHQFEKLWLVLKNDSNRYCLAKEDIIRLGLLKLRVKDLSVSSCSGQNNFSLLNIIGQNDENSEEHTETFKLPCRICLSELFSSENPLISPCKCGGTMKYIHLNCLRKSLMIKLVKKYSESVLSFKLKKSSCELCKKTYPYRLILSGKPVELIDIPKPPGQYIILEELCTDKNSLKRLHVVHLLEKNSVKIGRSLDCDLRISEGTVSRSHAKISFSAGKFILEDNDSKYGTLIQIKRSIMLDPSKDTIVQSGKSFIKYSVTKPFSIFLPFCFKPPSNNYFLIRGSPILPFNNGIPLSVEDPSKLFSYIGMAKDPKKVYYDNKNILYDYNQIGANSSFELEERDSFLEDEEVEVATNQQISGN